MSAIIIDFPIPKKDPSEPREVLHEADIIYLETALAVQITGTWQEELNKRIGPVDLSHLLI